jgi:hypothetical protein
MFKRSDWILLAVAVLGTFALFAGPMPLKTVAVGVLLMIPRVFLLRHMAKLREDVAKARSEIDEMFRATKSGTPYQQQ